MDDLFNSLSLALQTLNEAQNQPMNEENRTALLDLTRPFDEAVHNLKILISEVETFASGGQTEANIEIVENGHRAIYAKAQEIAAVLEKLKNVSRETF